MVAPSFLSELKNFVSLFFSFLSNRLSLLKAEREREGACGGQSALALVVRSGACHAQLLQSRDAPREQYQQGGGGQAKGRDYENKAKHPANPSEEWERLRSG